MLRKSVSIKCVYYLYGNYVVYVVYYVLCRSTRPSRNYNVYILNCVQSEWLPAIRNSSVFIHTMFSVWNHTWCGRRGGWWSFGHHSLPHNLSGMLLLYTIGANSLLLLYILLLWYQLLVFVAGWVRKVALKLGYVYWPDRKTISYKKIHPYVQANIDLLQT